MVSLVSPEYPFPLGRHPLAAYSGKGAPSVNSTEAQRFDQLWRTDHLAEFIFLSKLAQKEELKLTPDADGCMC